jgi:Tfp pilus assembly protein FimT
VPIELLVVLVAVAVLLGLAVGVLSREIMQQRRRAKVAEQATLRGRVKAGVRKGAERVAKETVKASRKSAWWMFKRRFGRDRKDSEE